VHTRDTIVIGASAGGVEALKELVGYLSSELEAALFVVLHVPSRGTSLLPKILQRSGLLPAIHPEDGEPIRWGRIYVAPPDRHLVLREGKIHLSRGPKENGFRPAIDPLFHSAARTYDSRVIGVILSGMLGDGSGGLKSIKNAGGIAIVQDPQEAIFSDMPLNAIESVAADYILPVAGIAAVIEKLTERPVRQRRGTPMPDEPEKEREIVKRNLRQFETGGDPSLAGILTCPECGGVIWELNDGELVNYRCHVGHVFSMESFVNEQAETLEVALWSAIRALEERSALLQRMAVRCQEHGSIQSAHRFSELATEAEQNADVIRTVLLNGKSNVADLDEEADND
jgi:two-component system chemotaxis response regulator CheB